MRTESDAPSQPAPAPVWPEPGAPAPAVKPPLGPLRPAPDALRPYGWIAEWQTFAGEWEVCPTSFDPISTAAVWSWIEREAAKGAVPRNRFRVSRMFVGNALAALTPTGEPSAARPVAPLERENVALRAALHRVAYMAATWEEGQRDSYKLGDIAEFARTVLGRPVEEAEPEVNDGIL